MVGCPGTLWRLPRIRHERMRQSAMKHSLLGSLATLLACTSAFAATDVSGKWAGATMYLILKQEGNKLSGSAGPTEKEQILTLENGKVEGDRVTFKTGSFQVSLTLNGDEMRGEMRNEQALSPI